MTSDLPPTSKLIVVAAKHWDVVPSARGRSIDYSVRQARPTRVRSTEPPDLRKLLTGQAPARPFHGRRGSWPREPRAGVARGVVERKAALDAELVERDLLGSGERRHGDEEAHTEVVAFEAQMQRGR